MKKLLFFVAMFCSIAMTAKAATETCDCGSLVKITATPKEGYHFVQWSDGNTDSTRVVEVNENLKTYVATFAPNLYEISFKNWNGELLLSAEKLPYGSAITYKGAVPEKEVDPNKSTWEFIGWEPSLEAVPTVPAHAQSFTAVFKEIPTRYTVTFYNNDGSVIKSDQVPYGGYPTFPIKNPERMQVDDKDIHYTWTFAGWEPKELVPVTEKPETHSYTAQYTKVAKTYTITFKDGNGKTVYETEVAYGDIPVYDSDVIPTKDETYEYKYEWDGTWKPDLAPVTGPKVYTANFKEIKQVYTVTFKDYDGTVLHKESVEYGKMAQNIPVPERVDTTGQWTYTFDGWATSDPSITPVTEKIETQVYTATYKATKNKYTITLTGEGGEYIGAGTYEYGTEVTIIAKPEGCKNFVKWSDGDTNATRKITVTGDATYTAEFEHITYTITVESADETMGTVTIEKL